MIRDAGYVESTYVAEQRRLTVRRQIAMSVSGELKAPLTALRMIDRFQNEKRGADLITLGPAQAGDIPKPDETTLKKYFDDHKIQFRAPETRKLILLTLTPADQARWNTVPEAEVKNYYEQHKADYATPERRQLRQIVFPNAEDAKAASERIAKGASFDDIAKERGLAESDIDLGTVTKANVIDPKVADAAFALREGEVSAPVQGSFGAVLVQAVKIEPGTQKTLEEVAPQINKTIAEQRARTEIGNLRDKIEDERAGGATLAETAKKLGLTVRTIDAVDRSGRGADGAPISGLPQGVDVITAAFASDVGVDADPLQLPGGGYVWYDVAGISPSHERNLEDIKPEVETRWRDDEIAARLSKKADDLLGKLKAGGTMVQAAADTGTKVESASGLQRGQPTPAVPGKVLDAIFRTAKGGAGSTEGSKPTERVVFTVTEVVDPDVDLASEQAKKLQETLNSSYVDDLLAQYVTKLESEMGVDINQQAVAQVTGSASN
jgi:peptidyl-prolyl cis-trans isomerase D